jgi:hypothetical protein
VITVVPSLDRHLVLEEYQTERPAGVLDGWTSASSAFTSSVTSPATSVPAHFSMPVCPVLLALLPRYDVGWWSRYGLPDHRRPDLAKPFYHPLHSLLLDALNPVRPDTRLHETARRWEAQMALSRCFGSRLTRSTSGFAVLLTHGVRPLLGLSQRSASSSTLREASHARPGPGGGREPTRLAHSVQTG